MSEPRHPTNRRGPSRRDVLALGAAGVAAGATGLRAEPARPNLGAMAERAGILYGTPVDLEVETDPAFRGLVKEQTRYLSTELGFKFDWLRPTEDRFDYRRADAVVALAEEMKAPVRAHTLVWNDWPPLWLRGKSSAELARVIDSHIETVVTKYLGRISAWDVVNEPFEPWSKEPGGWRTGPWYEALGPAYIARAFRRVASLDKSARLVLNEAFCERDDKIGETARARMLALVDRLLDEGVPVNTIGLQGHLSSEWRFNPSVYADFVGQLAKRGFEIHITELDVSDRTFRGGPEERDRLVAALYTGFMRAVLSVPAVKVVQTWGLSDRYTSIRGFERKMNPRSTWLARPLPFDDELRPKAAAFAIAEAFRNRSS